MPSRWDRDPFRSNRIARVWQWQCKWLSRWVRMGCFRWDRDWELGFGQMWLWEWLRVFGAIPLSTWATTLSPIPHPLLIVLAFLRDSMWSWITKIKMKSLGVANLVLDILKGSTSSCPCHATVELIWNILDKSISLITCMLTLITKTTKGANVLSIQDKGLQLASTSLRDQVWWMMPMTLSVGVDDPVVSLIVLWSYQWPGCPPVPRVGFVI
jgi:hypothetical protein